VGAVIVERGWGVAGGRVVVVVIAIRIMTVVVRKGWVEGDCRAAGALFGEGRRPAGEFNLFGAGLRGELVGGGLFADGLRFAARFPST
jgi:hypothetical protein